MNIFVTVLFLACLVVLHAGTLRPKIEEAITENNLRNMIGVGDCDCSNPYCCPSSGYVCTNNCPTGGGFECCPVASPVCCGHNKGCCPEGDYCCGEYCCTSLFGFIELKSNIVPSYVALANP